MRIDNELGAFVGVVDMSAYMDKHDIDADTIGKKAPFEKPLIGFKHYVEHGNDEGLDIAITQVIVVFVFFAVAIVLPRYSGEQTRTEQDTGGALFDVDVAVGGYYW